MVSTENASRSRNKQGYGSLLAYNWARSIDPNLIILSSTPFPFCPLYIDMSSCKMWFLISAHLKIYYANCDSFIVLEYITYTVLKTHFLSQNQIFNACLRCIFAKLCLNKYPSICPSVSSTLKASPLGGWINRGSLKATTVDAQLFSILSNHVIRVSAPHPQRREGPSSALLTTILCGVPGSFCVSIPGSFVYLHHKALIFQNRSSVIL